MSAEKSKRSGQWITDNKLERIFKRSKKMGVNIERVFDRSEKTKREQILAAQSSKQHYPQFIYMNKSQMKTTQGVNIFYLNSNAPVRYSCDQCLQSFDKEEALGRHLSTCTSITMPGKEIYRDKGNNISVFECCGFRDKSFCRELCILGSCFISSKTVLQDYEPFFFYVMFKRTETENEQTKYSFVGYFSKQKYQYGPLNLNCLLVLPCYQGSGYGRFLISLSFLLSKVEGMPGGPEYPLSNAADGLYSKYILDTVYLMAYKYGVEQKKKDPETTGDNFPFSLQFLESETGIQDRFLLKIMKQLKIVSVKTKAGDVEVKFNMDMRVIIESVAKQKTKLRAYNQLLKWKPQPSYTVDEMLHYPDIEREKHCNETGEEFDLSIDEHPKTGIWRKFKYSDDAEEVNKTNDELSEKRSEIFTRKETDKTSYPKYLSDAKKSAMTQEEQEEFVKFIARNKRYLKAKKKEGKKASKKSKKSEEPGRSDMDVTESASEEEREKEPSDSEYETDSSPAPFVTKKE